MVNLGSNALWAEFYFLKLYGLHYKKEVMQEHNHFVNDSPIELWFLKESNEFWKDTRDNFNIGNGITIEKNGSHYKELFYFSAHKDNYDINNFYLNNLDLLNKFIFYFKDKASKTINRFESRKMNVPSYYRNLIQPMQQDKTPTLDGLKEAFNEELNIDKYYLGDEFQDRYLTKRELECIKWVAYGRAQVDIAKTLGISQKTVETHISNVKAKLNCFKSAQLVHRLHSLLL